MLFYKQLFLIIKYQMSRSPERRRTFNDVEPSNNVYVCFLPSDVEQNDLKNVFQQCGQVKSVYLKKKQDGFAFAIIEYGSIREAQRAIKRLNRKSMGDKSISVKFAKPKPVFEGKREDRKDNRRDRDRNNQRDRSRDTGRDFGRDRDGNGNRDSQRDYKQKQYYQRDNQSSKNTVTETDY